jgi:hypothetical protein
MIAMEETMAILTIKRIFLYLKISLALSYLMARRAFINKERIVKSDPALPRAMIELSIERDMLIPINNLTSRPFAKKTK